jgi:hypothetical protein
MPLAFDLEPDLSLLSNDDEAARAVILRLFAGHVVSLRGTHYALNSAYELCSVIEDTVHLAPHQRILFRLARNPMTLPELKVWCLAVAEYEKTKE